MKTILQRVVAPLRKTGMTGGRTSDIVRIFAFILVAVVSVWTLVTIVSRVRAENRNTAVDICLDLNEAAAYCQLHNYPLADFAQRCRAIGVSSFVLGEENIAGLAGRGKIVYFPATEYSRLRLLELVPPGSPINANSLVTADRVRADNIIQQLQLRYGLGVTVRRAGRYQVLVPGFASAFTPAYWGENLWMGFDRDKMEFAASQGFKLYLRPENAGNAAWLGTVPLAGVSGVVWEGKEAAGYPARTDVTAHWIRENALKLVNLEFVATSGMDPLRRALAGQTVLGHVVPVPELNRSLKPLFWTNRWVRAVRERGVRFALFHLWEGRSVEDNLAYLRQTAWSIKRSGFVLSPAEPPHYPDRGYHRFWLLLAAGIGIFVPLLALAEGRKPARPLYAFLAVNGITIAGGLCISAVLYDVYFMQKILEFPPVKLTMFAPLLLAVFILYPPEQIRKFWTTPFEMKHVLVGAAVIAAVAVLAARSGNSAAEWLKADTGMRQWLEDVFVARPRTKEFLIGQPLLFLGFFYRRPYLVLIGMVGQVSIINTFLHAHTPLMLSLARTLHGLWLGLAIGYLAMLAFGAARKRLLPSKA